MLVLNYLNCFKDKNPVLPSLIHRESKPLIHRGLEREREGKSLIHRASERE